MSVLRSGFRLKYVTGFAVPQRMDSKPESFFFLRSKANVYNAVYLREGLLNIGQDS